MAVLQVTSNTDTRNFDNYPMERDVTPADYSDWDVDF